jgi:hypothetical protein
MALPTQVQPTVTLSKDLQQNGIDKAINPDSTEM